MTISLQRNQSLLNIDDTITHILTEDVSYNFENIKLREEFQTASSTVVTIDLISPVFIEIFKWRNLLANPLPFQILEVQEWEKIVDKINALEAVSGLLNDLTYEQMEIFESAVKRRSLFK